MQRVAMVIRLRPERAEEYERLHAEPWQEVLVALRAAHITNYSIFRHGDLLFGYFEYHGDDLDADLATVAADPATQRWWQLTDPCQEPLPTAPPGSWWADMKPVFLME